MKVLKSIIVNICYKINSKAYLFEAKYLLTYWMGEVVQFRKFNITFALFRLVTMNSFIQLLEARVAATSYK